MHMLYAGIPLKVLQSLMGHKSISSTEVYTKVFALDVAARHRVQFQMPEADAVAMLKGNIKVLRRMMLANVLLAGEVCQTLSGPADGNIGSVFLILLIDRMLKHRNTF